MTVVGDECEPVYWKADVRETNDNSGEL